MALSLCGMFCVCVFHFVSLFMIQDVGLLVVFVSPLAKTVRMPQQIAQQPPSTH